MWFQCFYLRLLATVFILLSQSCFVSEPAAVTLSLDSDGWDMIEALFKLTAQGKRDANAFAIAQPFTLGSVCPSSPPAPGLDIVPGFSLISDVSTVLYSGLYPPGLPVLRSDVASVHRRGQDPALIELRIDAPAHPMSSDVVTVNYSSLYLPSLPERSDAVSSSTAVRRRSKFSQLLALRSTVIKCDNDRDLFQCSKPFSSRRLLSVFFKSVPVILKYMFYFANNLNDCFWFLSLPFFRVLTNITRWVFYCKLSYLYSPSWKVQYISLQLSKSMHLRHNFRALRIKFVLKTTRREEKQQMINLVALFLKGIRGIQKPFCSGYSHACFHLPHSRKRKHNCRSSNQWRRREPGGFVPLQAYSSSQTLHEHSKH